MKKTPLEILNFIAQVIYDKKGSNILALDVQGISSIADYLIIAEGNVDRHVISIAKAVIDELRKQGEAVSRVEGLTTGDWIVIDCSGIMVHLFMPGLRNKYSLEKLWQESKIIDLVIDTSKYITSHSDEYQ